ncbi:MAG: ImmA/IrrE family metallo-endopeptidase [Sediminibacterium sp.]|nr:ImmA/IrrE family metallo-endopeptidase [Sediminibacterium sp.]MBX9780215.1 XRE family transcriptional regulator [Chitinophagaceae bacterium]
MNAIFSERFKSARLLNGLSLQDLANTLENKVSRQALHKYEKGEVIPDSIMLGELSKALNVRPEYFFRDTKVEIEAPEYRKLKRLPVKEEAKVVEQTREYLSRYIELEALLGIDRSFENPLVEFSNVSNFSQVNDAAKKLRQSWCLGLDPIYNIVELLEDKEIKVVKLDADMAFDGLQTWVNDKTIPVVAYNGRKIVKKDRIRFTLLHELAHLLLKFDENISDNQKEILCNQFAGAMLLPEKTLKEELGNHRNRLFIPEIGNIKKQYGISLQAIVMRAKDCGIVNEHYTKQFFFMIRQLNWKIDEPEEFDYEGTEESNRFEQLLYRALAEELITMSKAAALKNQSLAQFRKETLVV